MHFHLIESHLITINCGDFIKGNELLRGKIGVDNRKFPSKISFEIKSDVKNDRLKISLSLRV